MNPFTKLCIIIGLLAIPLLSSSVFGTVQAWKFTAVGDVENTSRGKAVASITKKQPNEVSVFLGDTYDKEKAVLALFKESGVPLLVTCGNHDDCKDMLGNDGMKFSSFPFQFKHKDACFISVNTESSISNQRSKIEGFLNNCQSDNNIKHSILFEHKNAITNNGAHHKESEFKARAQYATWDTKYSKFDLLLQGHNHNYQVCEPESPDILVVTAGTGSRSPYPIGSFGGNDAQDHCNVNQSGHKYDGPVVVEVNDTGYKLTKINLG